MECADENTGENPKPIQVRKINARMMLENDDATEMELLPLVRIVRATGEEVGLPKADPQFVPACLVLSGSPVLAELVRDLVNQVEASRKELVVQLTRGGFSIDTLRGLQFEQIMRLRTLNRFSARLPSLLATPNLPPFAMYLELRELLGELAALHPDLAGQQGLSGAACRWAPRVRAPMTLASMVLAVTGAPTPSMDPWLAPSWAPRVSPPPVS
jgi:type VI secretion system protein ImpJ